MTRAALKILASSSRCALSLSVLWWVGRRPSPPTIPRRSPRGASPPICLVLFQQASAASTCGVPWTLLAAVAKTESSFDATAVSSAGAEGMFQFEPATFAAYAKPTPPGGAVPATPFDPTDAAYAAARYLCSLGVANNPTLALVAYNCGNPGPACQAASAGYAQEVLATAASLHRAGCVECRAVSKRPPSPTRSRRSAPPTSTAATAPQTGFDCSGLVVWAYGLAGVVVPRVANDQWHDEPHVALDELVPGDLVFFGSAGSSNSYADHVGIYVGDSAMVDAPLHRCRCPHRHHSPRGRGRLGRRRGRARCGRSGGGLMGSAWTCGCRGGKIIPLRPDVKVPI